MLKEPGWHRELQQSGPTYKLIRHVDSLGRRKDLDMEDSN